VADQLVLGFVHHTLVVFSPRTSVGGTEVAIDHSARYQLLGLFADFYPSPTDGWHATASFGVGVANLHVADSGNSDTGIGLAVACGYDLWIGEQWSLGLATRLLGIAKSSDDFGSHRALIP